MQDREAAVRSVHRVCRGPLSEAGKREVKAAFAEGNEAMARAMDALHREPCGADINALILEHALDGKPKAAPCHGCGRIVKWVPVDLGEA